jgi:hypothetical protein
MRAPLPVRRPNWLLLDVLGRLPVEPAQRLALFNALPTQVRSVAWAQLRGSIEREREAIS